MAISRKLILTFTIFYILTIVYLLLFLLVDDFQNFIIDLRARVVIITEANNYFWALFISFFICFIGSASIGFPIPFPFVLFLLSNSLRLKYANQGLLLDQILVSGAYWSELIGIALIGGLGSIFGEYISFYIGKKARKVIEKKPSQTLQNISGFGKYVLDKPKYIKLYVFIAAATPISDDWLMASISMSDPNFKFRKLVLVGWMGKNVTTFFYCLLGIFQEIGLLATNIETSDVSSIVTEAIMLLVTLALMFFILAFNWEKYFNEKRTKKKDL
ncbi:MAG: hypothetical protein ACTSV5_06320 [Promethearchaeota archaeon]